MVTPADTLTNLRNLKSYEDLLELLHKLGFTHADEPWSTADWPASVRDVPEEVKVAARHGDFAVFYAKVPEDRMLTWERLVAGRILAAEPHSLIVFSDPTQQLWHFVHVRYDERLERRRQLRRFAIDHREPRAAERLRTMAERLSKLSIASGESLSVLELQDRCDEAFRVSEVTKHFLASFVKVVGSLTDSLLIENPSILADERAALRQAQLLLDRLIFLYFVQKKGWLNGEQEYLHKRFRPRWEEDPKTDTFYREYLLPVFRALSHRQAPRPRLENGEEEALPFLNGGLFDIPLAWGTANPSIDERIRVSNESLYPVFEDFLERYNFTTTEDSPLDVEVAINPEVIGTIFETFVLTSENDAETNAPDRRKATGSYYTPRVVVHFICRAVLRRYLAERSGVDEDVIKQLIEFLPAEQLTPDLEEELRQLVNSDEALEIRKAALEMKACDPAVGSGAFLVGLLQETVKLVSLLDLRREGRQSIQRLNYSYDLKKQLIESCLYGVDIQEQAIQICELRLWLSLVVEYQTDLSLPLRQRIDQIRPLPNLTFRVRVGDSLLDQLFGRDWEFRSTTFHADLVQRLRELTKTYFGFESPEGKRELEMQILGVQLQLLEQRLEEERKNIGADLPMFSSLATAQQRKDLETAKQRLSDIEELLANCQEAQHQAALPLLDSWEHTRRFDEIRRKVGVSFIWALDFAEVFENTGGRNNDAASGFDIIVGNPPFVTARNPDLRRRYRNRWPTSCYKKYHMLAPFTEVALLKLLKPGGELGYILSNAFATRDFGKPLIEQVFSRADLFNVIDCSGLSFPGHGTPTYILLGRATVGIPGKTTLGRQFAPGNPMVKTSVCGIQLGKGQLRFEPEETELWGEIELGWENTGFKGHHITVVDWSVEQTRTHPWSLNAGGADTRALIDDQPQKIASLITERIGYGTVVGSEEIFVSSIDFWRRVDLDKSYLRGFLTGDDLRDWSAIPSSWVLSPYDVGWSLLDFANLPESTQFYFKQFETHLKNRLDFGSKTYDEVGKAFWAHHQVTTSKYLAKVLVGFPFVVTHFHAQSLDRKLTLNRHCNLASIDTTKVDLEMMLALLNSSTALFYLKQVCYNKGAGTDAERDRFEYAGGKVEQLPVPGPLTDNDQVKTRANALALVCSDLGAKIPGLHPRKLFELPGEAYTDWYLGIPNYQEPYQGLSGNWLSSGDLLAAWNFSKEETWKIRQKMVAYQEEMDWLMYGAYGLLPLDDPGVNLDGAVEPTAFNQLDRPYRLIQHQRLTPQDWPELQKALWQERLRVIEVNEHVRQIEHPAYKRRWDQPFGDNEFLEEYEWWLCEKAEWLLEYRHGGEPIALSAWADELLKDPRVQAAYQAALEIGSVIGDQSYQRERVRGDFSRHFKRIIEDKTVPDKRQAFKIKHEKFRGIDPQRHLPSGVPSERFRSLTGKPDWYCWAGNSIWNGVQGDAWDT